MEKKISVLSIIIEKKEAVEKVNNILHENAKDIIGRMGMPYKEKNINVICIILDCESDTLSKIAGKLGMIDGVSSKALTTK